MNPKNIIWIFVMLLSCVPDTNHDTTDKKAASDEVSEFIESFEGRGDLTDETQSTPPKEAVSLFKHPDDLAIDLVLAEPEIFQPVEIKFDRHGRLWVVQYSQYPYPEGLKITSVDNHLRVQFDKVPEAPPAGVTGADKITFFEDTNGDGVFDKSTTAISGLNIATSVLTGSGRIWVLNPPYLLAYPDHDDNGIPDGDPEVHLQGFGLEDTHAVANNLRWGPDGWIYGAQGSTTTADVSSAVTKHIRFQGQAIWRYHPERKTFEIFAEGGGNTFDVELDEKGRLYSGDNGNDRGQYYKQGAYYVKNWGKHGPHTNPYSFGYLPNMALEGDKKRFTHAWIKYEENRLPLRYRNKMLAINPLQSYIQMTRLEPNGSTFRNFDEERILETPDHWFRPVDIKAGPDGAVYLADWYDSRLSHVDPRDTWDKKSGRVYRLRDAQSTPGGHQVDLAKWSDEELISGLSSDQKWIRQQVQRILADRKDPHYIQLLTPLLKNENGQIALEALWGLNACGAFDATLSLKTLQHTDPFVRMWSVRLIGDQMSITQEQGKALVQMAISEMHPEVRSQLAATAKRIDYHYTSQIIKALLSHKEDDIDPDIPLQTWWAIEAKILTHPSIGSEIFAAPDVWMSPTAQHTILSRLGQRLVAGNTEECYHTLDVLLQQAPKHQLAKPLVTGILEGLRGRDLQSLPATLYATLQSYSDVMEEGAHAFGIRKGEENHMSEAAKVVQDPDADIQERLSYIKIFGDIIYPPVVE
ncbi:MAG: hypothetical protein KDC53_24645, partial [Saprospiraceae bacterium]|nr:hypothetical protein [Saprospiraceae bacterium]